MQLLRQRFYKMQLYALDGINQVIFASEALKGKSYSCPECKKAVYRRGGLHRQDHFYHLEVSPYCRQSGKSQEHLNVQAYFLSTLPKGDCQLEYRFPEIDRIADVFWVEKKIVFEVQCSSIDLQEVIERNRDYTSLGINVVWILHDKKFNKGKLSVIESYLHRKPHYFTNIDENGLGYVYDQFSLLHKGKRFHRFDPLPIEVSDFKIHRLKRANLPKKKFRLALERLKERPIHFAGDIVDSYLNNFQPIYLSEAAALEESFYRAAPLKKRILTVFWNVIVKPYKVLFQLFFERCCR